MRNVVVPSVLGALLCLPALQPALATSEALAYASTGAGCAGDSSLEVVDTPPFSDALVIASATGEFDGICSGFNFPGYVGTAGAVVYASLRRGEMSAFAEATGGPIPGGSIRLSIATGDARLQDTVTILGPTPSFSTTVRIGLHVDGTLTGASGIYGDLRVGNVLRFGCFNTSPGLLGCGTLVPAGLLEFDVFIDVPVSSSSPSFAFNTAMSASAVDNGQADASSTGSLSILLPAGYSFTSGSGVLLVPEPSVLALLGSSLVLVISAGAHRARLTRRRAHGAARPCPAVGDQRG